MSVVTREQALQFDNDAVTVLKMLTDADFYARKYAALGFRRIRLLAHEDDGDRFSVQYSYDAAADLPVPAWARKLVPSTVSVQQTDSWCRSTRSGHVDVRLHGMPVNIAMDMTLNDGAAQLENLLHWRFECRLPLIGGKLAQFVCDDVVAKAENDHRFVRQAEPDYRKAQVS